MSSRKAKLLQVLSQEGAIDALKKSQAKRRMTPEGKIHPFYDWKPRCAPFTTIGERPGSVPNLTFQRDIPYCKARLIGLSGANGIGKTDFGAYYTASRAMGKLPLFSDVVWDTPQMIWVCGEPKLLSGLFERILGFIPKDLIEKKLDSSAHQYLKLKNGSEIKMKSTGMDREEFQMDNVNLIWCDEEPPKKIWIELRARLRRPDSQMLLTFTPVKGTTFMHDTLKIAHASEYLGKMEGPLALFTARMEDNDKLPQVYIDDIKDDCRGDQDMYDIRVEGLYKEMRGRRLFSETDLDKLSDGCRKPDERIIFDERGKPMRCDAEYGLAWDVWKRPVPRMHYAAFADLSEGTLEGDYTAAFVGCVETGEMVARFHGKIEPGEFGRDFNLLGRWYNCALLGWEKNMQGAAVYDVLYKQVHYPRLYKSENFSGRVMTDIQAYGFRTDKNSKMTIIQNLQHAIHDGKVVFWDEDAIEELLQFGYLRKDEGSSRKYGMGAMSGHDDLVIALAGTQHVMKRVSIASHGPVEPDNFGDWLEEETLKGLKKVKKARMMPGGLVK